MGKNKRSKRKQRARGSQGHDVKAAATEGNKEESSATSIGEKRKHIVTESCATSAAKRPRQGTFQKPFVSHASKPNSLFFLQRVTVNMMCQIEAFRKAKCHSEVL
jgi:hypothetical protein